MHLWILLSGLKQGWDKHCPASKFQWKMPESTGMQILQKSLKNKIVFKRMENYKLTCNPGLKQ